MKKLTLWLLTGLVGILTLVSFASAASACGWLLYQPEVPAKLRKE
ncbi:MAG: cyclic lactone autoinducer peptide [Dethiobacter sp.]|jgi:cyclic lactone autoinducer peptide|nr:MAG: cyclic lactone autoinducer peptide [Dethiobacter sp.]